MVSFFIRKVAGVIGMYCTLSYWPKISHFWPPCSQAGKMARVKLTLNHIFLYIYMWFEALKSFNVIPGSLGDHAIVTWFWPQNGPFLTPPCTQEKDGRGQSGPKSCFPIDIDVIWGVKEFPLWFQGPGWPCHCDLILTSKTAIFDPPVHTRDGWQGSELPQIMFSYWYRCDLRRSRVSMLIPGSLGDPGNAPLKSGGHFSFDMLPSWADQGSCAHKCVC